MFAALRGRIFSFPMITCGRARCTIASSHTEQTKVMADRLACKLAFCSCSNASFFVLPPSIATAPRGTLGHNFTQVSSKLMCTTTCPGAACASKKLLHCQVAAASDMYPWSAPELPKRPKPGPKIAPTFRALLFKEYKVMVLVWRPESGHHFWPRNVVSGSTFGGLGVPHLAPSLSTFPGATCPPV